MKEYLNILWQNLFVKTFDYKGRTNRREFIICNIFWCLLFTIAAIVGTSDAHRNSDSIKIVNSIYLGLLIYLRAIPFIALRVRRLHDIGEKGTKLILLFIVAFIAPIGLGFIWLMAHMYDKSVDTTHQINTRDPEPLQTDSKNSDIEVEDVEL